MPRGLTTCSLRLYVIKCYRFVNVDTRHRYIRKVVCSKHISLKKDPLQQEQVLEASVKKASGLAWQVGQVTRCAHFNCQYFCCGH
jgi:hypothetical protein